MQIESLQRRKFLEFLGQMSALSIMPSVLAGCGSVAKKMSPRQWDTLFIGPTSSDEVVLAQGLQKKILLKWQDLISPAGLQFGTNNDFCAFIAKDPENPTDGVLMVNHEAVNPLFVSGFDEKGNVSKSREQIEKEQQAVGVSLVRFYQDNKEWKVDTQAATNRRITAQTEIPFSTKFPIDGAWKAKGTLANCAGGTTPWRTFLTCEENYDQFYGEWDYSPKPGQKRPRKNPKRTSVSKDLSWSLLGEVPPTHYGWVVEINPWTGAAKKLTSLGRFCHEAATCTRSLDGKAVVYMGDDAANQYLYKFISRSADSLETGTLYVAQMEEGRWLPLTLDSHPDFKKLFRNETDMMMRVREAAKILGATPLDRPEDIEINPRNGDIIVALTNNPLKANEHGSLLRLQEKNGDPGALHFQSGQWISGGEAGGLSCPDNLVFDKSGNLWCTNDIADEKMNRGVYSGYKNNGLYFIPMRGPRAGQVFQVASAPMDAEFTGPMFTPDGETLLLSVQHPGDQTVDLKKPTSCWPEGPGHLPKSALIALTGETLKFLVHYVGD